MGLINITLDINGLLNFFKELGLEIQQTVIMKNITQFEKDLYFNLDIFRSLYRLENLSKTPVNDPLIKKELAKVKTPVMEKVSDWRHLYLQRSFQYGAMKEGKSDEFFTYLSIALAKIKKLKEFSAMTDKQLKKTKCRTKIRLNHIIKFLCKLTKNERKAAF